MHYAELKIAWAELTAPGAPFEIAVIEVRGQPMRVYAHAPATVRALWLASAAYGSREYLIYQDERITYAQTHARVNAVAGWLVGEGVRPGDRVAIAMRNYPEWLIVYWACVAMGVAAVGMNAWWTAEEMAYAVEDSRPKAIFCDAERLERILSRPEMARGVKLVATRAPSLGGGAVAWDEVIAHPGGLPDVAIDPDDDA
ncbi:MAG: AMP-binding protein, partial [Caulobacteraceae bacterium]